MTQEPKDNSKQSTTGDLTQDTKKDLPTQHDQNREKDKMKKKEKTSSQQAQEQAEEKLRQMSENFLRLQAEFANYKKRTQEQQEQIYARATGNVLKELINVFDDFELALKNTSNFEEFKKGMELIFAKLVSTAEKMGLEKIKTVNKLFNPREHEALLTEKSKKPEHTILEELQAGYKIKDVIIRTAKVKVAKK